MFCLLGRYDTNLRQDYPMAAWELECSAFLDEMIRLEGRGDFGTQVVCPQCTSKSDFPEFRCEDCFSLQLICCNCTIHNHHNAPLHRMKVCCLFGCDCGTVANRYIKTRDGMEHFLNASRSSPLGFVSNSGMQ
jgi:hypothetical protein